MATAALNIQALKADYAQMDERELVAIVSLDANHYEAAALKAAREELSHRGIDSDQIAERVRELKANRFDELTSAASAAATAKLPRWMFWTCLIESGVIGLSVWIVLYLLWNSRKSAAKEALITICIGWALKALLFVGIPLALESLS